MQERRWSAAEKGIGMDAFHKTDEPQPLGVIIREYLAAVDIHRDRSPAYAGHESTDSDADNFLTHAVSSRALEMVGA